MEILKMELGKLGANCYFVYDKDNRTGIIIDPGGNYEDILEKISQLNIDVKAVLLTHGHCDHIGAVKQLKENLNIGVYIHAEDLEMLEDNEKNLSELLRLGDIRVSDSKKLVDGEILNFGNIKIEVLHTPGHTKGSVSFLIGDAIFTGDTLFRQSIGRTDFPGGSYSEIENSIVNKLYKLNDSFIVYPGHGSESSIGYEKKHNSFFNI